MLQLEKQKQRQDGKNIQDAHEAIRPTDIGKNTGGNQRISDKRSVPFVSADLEAVCLPAECNRQNMRQHL